MERDPAAVERLAGPEWSAAWESGDATAVADFYAPDAMLFPNGSPPVCGRKAIEESFAALFAEFRVTGSSDILELSVAGDWAYMRGAYTTEVHPKSGGETVKDRGAWIWIVKRHRDEGWKIFRAMGASEPPAQ